MKPDIDYSRYTGWVVAAPAQPGVTCPDCGSGEVYQPPQTMDMPMRYCCLRCGANGPSYGFDRHR